MTMFGYLDGKNTIDQIMLGQKYPGIPVMGLDLKSADHATFGRALEEVGQLLMSEKLSIATAQDRIGEVFTRHLLPCVKRSFGARLKTMAYATVAPSLSDQKKMKQQEKITKTGRLERGSVNDFIVAFRFQTYTNAKRSRFDVLTDIHPAAEVGVLGEILRWSGKAIRSNDRCEREKLEQTPRLFKDGFCLPSLASRKV